MGEAKQPHLSRAYYGLSIPLPSKSYHHPRRGGAGGCGLCSCFYGCIFSLIIQIILTAVIVVGRAVLIFWLLFRPNNVKFHQPLYIIDLNQTLSDCASMGTSPSMPVNRESNEIFSKPHRHGNTNTKTDLIVCRCCSIPYYFLFLLCWAFQFSFRVASETVPSNTSNGTSPPPALFLNTNSTGRIETHTHSPVDLKVTIVIVVSGVLFALLFFMGFLKFLRFKIRRKSAPDRVVAISDGDGSTANRPGESSGKDGDVRRFGCEEIKRVTTDFSMSRVIGSGGFSTVYLALFPNSTLGAVKIQCSSARLNQVYRQELQILLRLRHSNIVRLLGFSILSRTWKRPAQNSAVHP